MKLSTLSLGLLWPILTGAAWAQAPAGGEASPKSLEERLEELDQKVRILERKAELDKEAATEKAKTAGTATASAKEGFALRSPDGAFVVKLRGYVQADGRFFSDDAARPAADTFLLRRVRPIVEGTIFKNFDFRIMTDFGSGTATVQDAYLDARFHPAFKVRAGKFKEPFGIERLQSGTDLPFIERALPNNLVPNRDVGVQIHGDLAQGRFSYQIGVFNGVADGGSSDGDADDGKDLVGRISLQPFVTGSTTAKNLTFAIAASTGSPDGTAAAPALPSYRTPGQQVFFSYRSDGSVAGTTLAAGNRERFSPQLTYYSGPFGLLAEWVSSSQEVTRGSGAALATAKLDNEAWQIAASWVFGGAASYKGGTTRKTFDPANHGWGAFELKARYSGQDVDSDAFPIFADPARSARSAEAWALGLNWIFNKSVKWLLDYEETTFEGGATGGDRPDEKVLIARFQVAF